MKNLFAYLALIMFAYTPLHGHAGLFNKSGPEEQRAALVESRQDTLQQLFAEKPSAKQEIEQAAGYAVFSSVGVNLFVVASERGGGILRDNSSSDIYNTNPASLLWESLFTGKEGLFSMEPFQKAKDQYLLDEKRSLWKYDKVKVRVALSTGWR